MPITESLSFDLALIKSKKADNLFKIFLTNDYSSFLTQSTITIQLARKIKKNIEVSNYIQYEYFGYNQQLTDREISINKNQFNKDTFFRYDEGFNGVIIHIAFDSKEYHKGHIDTLWSKKDLYLTNHHQNILLRIYDINQTKEKRYIFNKWRKHYYIH
jgi:hypothetical protein